MHEERGAKGSRRRRRRDERRRREGRGAIGTEGGRVWELERLVSDVLYSKQTTVKTERRLLRQALFQPWKLIVPLRVVYGIKEYLYCYLIHFCNTFDDNNRSFRSVSWKRATIDLRFILLLSITAV